MYAKLTHWLTQRQLRGCHNTLLFTLPLALQVPTLPVLPAQRTADQPCSNQAHTFKSTCIKSLHTCRLASFPRHALILQTPNTT